MLVWTRNRIPGWTQSETTATPMSVAILKDLQQVVAGVRVERLEAPVIENQGNRCERGTRYQA